MKNQNNLSHIILNDEQKTEKNHSSENRFSKPQHLSPDERIKRARPENPFNEVVIL
jgi:hypothetical protein